MDSWSHDVARLQKEHRETCDRLRQFQAAGDDLAFGNDLQALDALEKRFEAIGARPPLRSFRVYLPTTEGRDRG